RLFALSEKMAFPAPAGWLAAPKSGDVMLPMIGPGLSWLVKLRNCIETVRLYRRPAAGSLPPAAPDGNGLAGPPRALPPGGPPRAFPPGAPLGLAGGGACSRLEPKVNVLLTRILNMIWPGPRPKLRGNRVWPGAGFGSSSP